jgi:hypothetical protein
MPPGSIANNPRRTKRTYTPRTAELDEEGQAATANVGIEMSRLIERWSQQLGRDAAEEALRRHPEIAEMSWQEQEILLQGLEQLHESMCVPVTVENSERLYGHYFKEAQPSEPTAFKPKSKEGEADFFQNATADQLKDYLLAKFR